MVLSTHFFLIYTEVFSFTIFWRGANSHIELERDLYYGGKRHSYSKRSGLRLSPGL